MALEFFGVRSGNRGQFGSSGNVAEARQIATGKAARAKANSGGRLDCNSYVASCSKPFACEWSNACRMRSDCKSLCDGGPDESHNQQPSMWR